MQRKEKPNAQFRTVRNKRLIAAPAEGKVNGRFRAFHSGLKGDFAYAYADTERHRYMVSDIDRSYLV